MNRSEMRGGAPSYTGAAIADHSNFYAHALLRMCVCVRGKVCMSMRCVENSVLCSPCSRGASRLLSRSEVL